MLPGPFVTLEKPTYCRPTPRSTANHALSHRSLGYQTASGLTYRVAQKHDFEEERASRIEAAYQVTLPATLQRIIQV